MTRLTIPLVLLAAIVAIPTAARAQQSAVSALSRDFVFEALALSPVSATDVGYHRHRDRNLDALLDDYTPTGIDQQRNVYTGFRDRIAKLDLASLTPDDRADLALIRGQIDAALLELDTIQNWRHNPTVYVETIGSALDSLHRQDFGSADERYRNILQRMDAIPAFLATAKKNLVSAPAIWIKVAIGENTGNRNLIESEVAKDVPAALSARYQESSKKALAALATFNQFLDGDLAQHPYDWRLGTDKYDRKFRATLFTDASPAQVLADAERDFDTISAEMLRLAGQIAPKYKLTLTGNRLADLATVLNRLAQDHAQPAAFLDSAKADVDAGRAFLKTHPVVGLPANDNLEVIATPEFLRGIYGVAGFHAAPPLQPSLKASYWVTPMEGEPEVVESRLRENNRFGIDIISLHEALPGHYLQAEYASRLQPEPKRLLRALFGSGAYVEGWAVYATEMALDQGYRDQSPELRLTFLKQMLRVLSNAIIDIRLQSGTMTDQQALDLMINQGLQEKAEATAKLQRAKLSSCQLPTYYVGYRDWKRLRSAWQTAQGKQFDLRRFHDSALNAGAVPLPELLRQVKP